MILGALTVHGTDAGGCFCTKRNNRHDEDARLVDAQLNVNAGYDLARVLRLSTLTFIRELRPSKGKGKEEYLYSAFWPRWYTQSAQAWITQFYLQITPCLPFLRERSPDVTTTSTEAPGIQLQLTTHLSTLKG